MKCLIGRLVEWKNSDLEWKDDASYLPSYFILRYSEIEKDAESALAMGEDGCGSSDVKVHCPRGVSDERRVESLLGGNEFAVVDIEDIRSYEVEAIGLTSYVGMAMRKGVVWFSVRLSHESYTQYNSEEWRYGEASLDERTRMRMRIENDACVYAGSVISRIRDAVCDDSVPASRDAVRGLQGIGEEERVELAGIYRSIVRAAVMDELRRLAL